MKCKQTHPGIELESPCPFSTALTIAIRPSLSLSLYIYIYILCAFVCVYVCVCVCSLNIVFCTKPRKTAISDFKSFSLSHAKMETTNLIRFNLLKAMSTCV